MSFLKDFISGRKNIAHQRSTCFRPTVKRFLAFGDLPPGQLWSDILLKLVLSLDGVTNDDISVVYVLFIFLFHFHFYLFNFH